MYLAIKHLHLLTLTISISLFFARWIASFLQAHWLRWKATKILPHVNDTLLLVSGLSLSFVIGQYPFVHLWLTVKLCLVVAYIGVAYMALKKARNFSERLVYGLGAFALFGLIILLAFHKAVPGITVL